MRVFALIYNSLIWGLLAAVLATRSLWLDMRIDVGLIIPAVVLISVIVGLITKNKLITTFRFTIVNLVSCFVLTFLVLGTKRLAVVPASILRESIHSTSVSFSIINWVFLIFLAAGLVAIWLWKPGSK